MLGIQKQYKKCKINYKYYNQKTFLKLSGRDKNIFQSESIHVIKKLAYNKIMSRDLSIIQTRHHHRQNR